MAQLTAAVDSATSRLIASARAIEASNYLPATTLVRLRKLAVGVRQAVLAREYGFAQSLLTDMVEIFTGVTETEELEIAEIVKKHTSSVSTIVMREANL